MQLKQLQLVELHLSINHKYEFFDYFLLKQYLYLEIKVEKKYGINLFHQQTFLYF